jgi:hypothetical protein
MDIYVTLKLLYPFTKLQDVKMQTTVIIVNVNISLHCLLAVAYVLRNPIVVSAIQERCQLLRLYLQTVSFQVILYLVIVIISLLTHSLP